MHKEIVPKIKFDLLNFNYLAFRIAVVIVFIILCVVMVHTRKSIKFLIAFKDK
jgi:hypothetical protein